MTTGVLITMLETNWSGWVPGGSAESKSVQVWTEEKTILSPITMGHETSLLPYEIEIDRIVNDVVVFAHRGLVVKNRDGTINLGGPSVDKFVLRWGESKKLATPTMDAGTSVVITVDEIR